MLKSTTSKKVFVINLNHFSGACVTGDAGFVLKSGKPGFVSHMFLDSISAKTALERWIIGVLDQRKCRQNKLNLVCRSEECVSIPHILDGFS